MQDHRLAAARLATIPSQGKDIAEAPVDGIVVKSLLATRNIEAEAGPGDGGQADLPRSPIAERVDERLYLGTRDRFLRGCPQVGIGAGNVPVIPNLVRIREVLCGIRKMGVDVIAHRATLITRKEIVDDDETFPNAIAHLQPPSIVSGRQV